MKISTGIFCAGWLSIFIGLLPLIPLYNEIQFDIKFDIIKLYLLFSATGFILSGAFILKLKNWARLLLLFMIGIHIPFGLGGVISFGPLTIAPESEINVSLVYLTVTSIFVGVPFIWALYFFNKKEIKKQFNRLHGEKDHINTPPTSGCSEIIS